MHIYRFEAGAQVLFAESPQVLTQEQLDERWMQLLTYAALRLYKNHEGHVGPYEAGAELVKPACSRIWAQLGLRLVHPSGQSSASSVGAFENLNAYSSPLAHAVGARVREGLARLNIRFVLTIEAKEGQYRTLLEAAQGRFTYATAEEAREAGRALFSSGNAARLNEIYGDRTDSIDVQSVECWPGHNDPKKTVFPLYGEVLEEDSDADI